MPLLKNKSAARQKLPLQEQYDLWERHCKLFRLSLNAIVVLLVMLLCAVLHNHRNDLHRFDLNRTISHLNMPGLIGSVLILLAWMCIEQEKTSEKRMRTRRINLAKQNEVQKKLAAKLVNAEAADFDRFDKARKEHFNKLLLRSDTHLDLVRAVLIAWERAGDSRAMPFVATLAEGRASAAANPDIRQQARNCLIALQYRAVQEQNSGILLRASTPAPIPEQMLRPAYDTLSNPEANAQLLRANQPPEDTNESAKSVTT